MKCDWKEDPDVLPIKQGIHYHPQGLSMKCMSCGKAVTLKYIGEPQLECDANVLKIELWSRDILGFQDFRLECIKAGRRGEALMGTELIKIDKHGHPTPFPKCHDIFDDQLTEILDYKYGKVK